MYSGKKFITRNLKFNGYLKASAEAKPILHEIEVTYNVNTYNGFALGCGSISDEQELIEKAVVKVFQECRLDSKLTKEDEFANVLNPFGLSYQDGGATPVSALRTEVTNTNFNKPGR